MDSETVQAVSRYQRAAGASHSEAQVKLIQCDLNSELEGVPRDLEEAVVWLKQAAEAELPNALFSLNLNNLNATSTA